MLHDDSHIGLGHQLQLDETVLFKFCSDLDKLVEALHSLELFNEGERWELKRYIHKVNQFILTHKKNKQTNIQTNFEVS